MALFCSPGWVVGDQCDLTPWATRATRATGSGSELGFSQIVGGSKPKQSSGMRITPASTLQPCPDPRTRSRSAGQGVPNCPAALLPCSAALRGHSVHEADEQRRAWPRRKETPPASSPGPPRQERCCCQSDARACCCQSTAQMHLCAVATQGKQVPCTVACTPGDLGRAVWLTRSVRPQPVGILVEPAGLNGVRLRQLAGRQKWHGTTKLSRDWEGRGGTLST